MNEVFRDIELSVKKLERTYDTHIAYLVSQANYYAACLNDLKPGSLEYNTKAAGYCCYRSCVAQFEKASGTKVSQQIVEVEHTCDLPSIAENLI